MLVKLQHFAQELLWVFVSVHFTRF